MKTHSPCCADCLILVYRNGPGVGCVNRRCYCHTWRQRQKDLEKIISKLAGLIKLYAEKLMQK
jgi:hypothetical protein